MTDVTHEAVWLSIDRIASKLGKSLPAMALHAGMDQSTFSHARRRRNNMSLTTILRLLYAYKITLSEWARIVEHEERKLRVTRRIKNKLEIRT